MAAETPTSPKRAAKKKSINGMSSPKSKKANISGGRSAASAKSATSSGSGGRRAGLSPKAKSKKKPRSLSPPGTGSRKKKAGGNGLGGSLHASSLHATSSSSSPKKIKKKSLSPKVSTNKRASSAGSGVEATPSPNPASKRKVKLTRMPTPPLSAPADMSSRRTKPKVQLPYLNDSDSEDSLDLGKSLSSVRGSKRQSKGTSQSEFNASMSSVASKRQNKGASQSDFNASLSSIGSTKSAKASNRKLNASNRLEVPLGSLSPPSPTRKSNAKIATNYLSPPLSPKRSMALDNASNHSTSSIRSNKNKRLVSMPELDSSAHKSSKQNINNTRSSSASAISKSGTGGESLAMQNKNKNKLQQVMENYGNVGKSSPNGEVEKAPNGASLAAKSLGQKNKSHNRSFFGRKNTSGTTTDSVRPNQTKRQNNGPMKYSRTLVIIWCVVIGELALDLVTTVISFIALVGDDTCCGLEIELGRLPLGTTIPFLVLILLELGLLFYSIHLTLRASKKPEDQQAAQKAQASTGKGGDGDEEDLRRKNLRSVWRNLRPAGSSQDAGAWFKTINVLVLLNPFFGCVVAWILLYQTSKAEAFSVLGLEGMSILLHWTSVYLEGHEQNRWTIALHLSPLLPFLVTCTVMLIFVWKEGVCYLVEEGKFNFEGCRVCADKTLPAEIKDGISLETDKINFDDFNRQYVCGDGSEPTPGEYCSSTTNFCFYAY